jgi:plastocyanin
MRVQDYSPPKLTLGIVGVVAIIIPVLVGYFLISGLGTSSAYTSDFAGGTSTTSVVTSTGPVSTVAISIPNGAGTQAGAPGFGPDVITVVIGVNNTVTWTNNDIAPHTVTANNQTAGVAVFDSSNLAVGASFTFTFTTPGIYLYHCNYHSWMIGTVKVVQG